VVVTDVLVLSQLGNLATAAAPTATAAAKEGTGVHEAFVEEVSRSVKRS